MLTKIKVVEKEPCRAMEKSLDLEERAKSYRD